MIQNYISCFAAKTPASVSDKLRLHRLKIEKFQPGYGSDEMAFATVQWLQNDEKQLALFLHKTKFRLKNLNV